MIGTRYYSQNYGIMEIIAKDTKKRYRVRFLQTGTEVVAEWENIKRGLVKDRFYPTVAGRGYLGSSNTTQNPRIYARWKRMMLACYDALHLDYASNNEQGVVVAEEWHNYEHYERDILQLLEENDNPEKYRIIRTGPIFSKENITLTIQK